MAPVLLTVPVQEAEDLESKPQYLKREKLAFYSPTETEKQRFCVESTGGL
jgi:hypothetical protein